MTIDPADSRRLFVAKPTGVHLSENSGVTWTQVLTFASWGITIDESDPSVVFITTKTNGVFRSFDGGRTFAATTWAWVRSRWAGLQGSPSIRRTAE